jgi:hypothetical protein
LVYAFTRATKLVRLREVLLKSSIGACVLFTALSAYACSSSDDNVAPNAPDTDAGAGGGSNTGGKSNGGSANGGARTGGATNGGGGATTGGSANGGSSGAGASGNGGASPDGSAPDGSAGSGDSGAGPQCVTIDVTNPDQCNKGVKIKDSCPPGRVVTNLTRCSDGSTFAPDAGYQEYTISACADTGCPVDSNHTVWRKIECCYPVPGSDAGDAGPADAGHASDAGDSG